MDTNKAQLEDAYVMLMHTTGTDTPLCELVERALASENDVLQQHALTLVQDYFQESGDGAV